MEHDCLDSYLGHIRTVMEDMCIERDIIVIVVFVVVVNGNRFLRVRPRFSNRKELKVRSASIYF